MGEEEDARAAISMLGMSGRQRTIVVLRRRLPLCRAAPTRTVQAPSAATRSILMQEGRSTVEGSIATRNRKEGRPPWRRQRRIDEGGLCFCFTVSPKWFEVGRGDLGGRERVVTDYGWKWDLLLERLVLGAGNCDCS